MNGKNQIKGSLTALVVCVMLVLAGAPVANATTPAEPEPEKQYKGDGVARGVVPVVPAIYLVNGAIIGSGVSYSVYEYLDNSELNESDLNKTLRSAVHDNAISTAGVTDSLYTDSYNDLNTIEGQIAQVISQDIAKDQDYNTQSDYNVSVENAVSEELEGQQRDFVETHNFNSVDVKNFIEKLDQANASDDAYVADSRTVSNDSEFNNAISDDVDIINVDSNISPNASGTKINTNTRIIGNGHTINLRYSGSATSTFQSANLTVENAIFKTRNHQFKDKKGLVLNLIDGTEFRTDNGWDVYQAEYGELYNDTESTYTVTYPNSSKLVNNKQDIGLGFSDVTLDPKGVQDANLENTVEFENDNNETVNITGISYQMATSYAGSSNNTLDVAMPYVNKSGTYEPIKYNNGSSLFIETPTSGVSDRVEPVPYQEAYNLIDTRDSRSDSVFTFATNYADDLYQSSQLSEVVQNDSKNVSDVSNLTAELGLLTVDKFSDSDDILSLYAGVYPSFQNVAKDRVNITFNGTTYDDAVLFSNNMTKLEETGNNNGSLDEGETLNGSKVSSAFLVDTNNGDKVDLGGTFTIDSVEDADDENATSLAIVDYTRDSVNLDDRAVQLEKSANVTIDVVDSAGGGSGGGVFDGVNSVLNDFADALGIDPAIVKVVAGIVVLIVAVRTLEE